MLDKIKYICRCYNPLRIYVPFVNLYKNWKKERVETARLLMLIRYDQLKKVFEPMSTKAIDQPGVGEALGKFARNVTWNVETPRLAKAIENSDKMRLEFSGTEVGEYYRDLTNWLNELVEHRNGIRKV